MSDEIWVCKQDGTIQCEPEIKGATLQQAREELETLIGSENVLEMERRIKIVPLACGTHTGNINAAKLSIEGYDLLKTGIVGPSGWEKCDGGDFTTLVKSHHDLIGYSLRVYHEGDAITKDYRQDRANVVLGSNELISDVWFG